MRILIVEDDQPSLLLLRAKLQAMELETLEAEDGVQALALLELHVVDAVISDILMPNMDGYQLCYELRRSERWRDLPFIFYTNTYDSPADEEIALAMGAGRFLRKPATSAVVLAALQEVIQRPSAAHPIPKPVQHVALTQYVALMKRYSEQLVRKLEVQNAELRMALEAGQIGTFEWDMPGNHIIWSRWHEEMWGFKPGEFAGTYEAFSQRVHAEDLPDINAEVDRCIASRDAFVREFRVVWPDGSVHWILGRGEFAFGDDGRPQRLRGTAMEITTRKLADLKLAASENRLRAIIDTEPECVKLLTADGLLLEINAAGLRMLEADTFSQVENHCVYPLVVEAHRQAFKALNEKVFAGESGMLAFQVVGLKGGRRWLEIHASPLRDAAGQVTALLGVTRDITEQKQAAAKLAEQLEELRAQNEELSHFNRVAVDRELRMVELKQQVNALLVQLGESPRYATQSDLPRSQFTT